MPPLVKDSEAHAHDEAGVAPCAPMPARGSHNRDFRSVMNITIHAAEK